jgi:3-hydroxymyristoyl/3-hydroxydecanoyl-(acyl carrier protein) dehydratase
MRFLFVESIHQFESGRRARGRITLPDGAQVAPCVIAEAVGQLAGWIAMEHAQFALRPVAGLVGECMITERPIPGAIVELAVEMDTVDQDAVGYSGAAFVNGRPLVTLERCGAPMLPLEDFDDPHAMRQRFAALISGVGPIACDPGLGEAVQLEQVALDDDGIVARITTPEEPAFYLDHFPRKPVFPATLLLDAEIRLASLAMNRRHGGRMPEGVGIKISNLKLRTFIQPGTMLELRADSRGTNRSSADFALATLAGGKRIATARLTFTWQ